MGTTAKEVAAHIAIKRKIHKRDFSSSIGTFIQLGSIFLNNGMEEIGKTYIPWVTLHLNGCLPDWILPYSIALWFGEKVRITISISHDYCLQNFGRLLSNHLVYFKRFPSSNWP